MNPVEFAGIAGQTEEVESAHSDNTDAPPRPATNRRGNPRLRYALLAIIVLLSAWLAISIRNSINEIDAEVEMIRAKIAAPSH